MVRLPHMTNLIRPRIGTFDIDIPIGQIFRQTFV